MCSRVSMSVRYPTAVKSPKLLGSPASVTRSMSVSVRSRCAITSLTVTILMSCSRANATRSGMPATEPSSWSISQITAAGEQPARRARSTDASVCPARTSTPPSRARIGKMWPGRVSCSGVESAPTRTWMVRARSAEEAPVAIPSRASTETVNCFESGDVLRPVMSGTFIASRRSPAIATQTMPRARVVMNAIISAVMNCAGMHRSPSFSRPSSSTMTTGATPPELIDRLDRAHPLRGAELRHPCIRCRHLHLASALCVVRHDPPSEGITAGVADARPSVLPLRGRRH